MWRHLGLRCHLENISPNDRLQASDCSVEDADLNTESKF